MTERREISRAEIYQIAWQVRDDEADPEEVRRLLEYICNRIDQKERLPPEILRYLRDSLREFLDGSAKSVDGALGLKKRKRGRRKISELTRLKMATEVLRLRLAGSNHRNALTVVGAQFFKEETTISDAWAARKYDALIALRVERDLDRFPWSDKEVQRLEEIFRKEQRFLIKHGYIAPEK